MKIKLLLFSLLFQTGAFAQSIEEYWYFDVSAGATQSFGAMTESNNSSYMKVNGGWSMNLGFTKYGSKGQFFKQDVLGFHMGYQFHVNSMDMKELNRIDPSPSAYKVIKGSQLLHGPVMRLEYTRAGSFAPYIGLGAHLLALRGAQMDVEFRPQDNYYKKVEYRGSGWGRLNASVSALAGLRIVLPNDWALGLHYELYLRDAWNTKYNVTAIPATIDNVEREDSFILTQLGWNQHIELRLQMPLR